MYCNNLGNKVADKKAKPYYTYLCDNIGSSIVPCIN